MKEKKNKTEVKENQIIKEKLNNKIKENINTKVIEEKRLNKNVHHKKNKNKKIIFIIVAILLILTITLLGIYTYFKYTEYQEEQRYKEKLANIQNSYNNYVITTIETHLYNENYEISGKVSSNMYLELEEIDENYDKEYFKIKDSNLHIKYTDIKKTEEQVTDNNRYKNYIPFNKSIVTNENTKLYIDENTYYIINENINLPVIVDDNDKYYAFFEDKLIFVYKEGATVIESNNSDLEVASSIAVLNYHFVVSKEAGEDKLCEPSSICHPDTQFDSHIKYITENGFYTITMKELEMFIDGKINLPKKSVSITIDDGWFVERSKQILAKYDAMGTLFLIGYLAPVSAYKTDNLEVHSHTWNLHNVSNCSGGRSPLLCYNRNTILEDLKQSRESLDNTTYFCYPFYDYNNYTIEVLKEAGFTMALAGGNRKVTRGVDKFKVPRYVVYSTTSTSALANMIN